MVRLKLYSRRSRKKTSKCSGRGHEDGWCERRGCRGHGVTCRPIIGCGQTWREQVKEAFSYYLEWFNSDSDHKRAITCLCVCSVVGRGELICFSHNCEHFDQILLENFQVIKQWMKVTDTIRNTSIAHQYQLWCCLLSPYSTRLSTCVNTANQIPVVFVRI